MEVRNTLPGGLVLRDDVNITYCLQRNTTLINKETQLCHALVRPGYIIEFRERVSDFLIHLSWQLNQYNIGHMEPFINYVRMIFAIFDPPTPM